MSKADKTVYRALKFFASMSEEKAMQLKRNNLSKYLSYVPEPGEKSLQSMKFVYFSNPPNKLESAITFLGTEYLRELEDHKLKKRSLTISIIALLISLIALLKSFEIIPPFS